MTSTMDIHTTPDLTDTPFTTQTTFDPLTPDLTASQSAVEHLLDDDENHHDLEYDENTSTPTENKVTLTARDVQADPILSSLAQKQQSAPPRRSISLHRTQSQISSTPSKNERGRGGGVFKARPAPDTTRAEGLGPKMTKAAALRLGIKWESKRGSSRVDDKEQEKDEVVAGTPGYKRVGLGINVPSLAAPTIAPRQTKASQLRLAGATTDLAGSPAKSTVRRDPEVIAAEMKARAAEEKERRRKSVVLPASLSAPSIAPRQNKSSILRTGGAAPPTSFKLPQPQAPSTPISSTSRTFTSLSRATSALIITSADNVQQKEKDEKLKRRSSVVGIVRSLGAPSITPRLDRAAMLRAPRADGTMPALSTPAKPRARPQSQIITMSKAPALAPTTPSIKSNPSTTTSTTTTINRVPPSPGPRPTKASLLRAGMGKKVV